jgi:hypothetical protein
VVVDNLNVPSVATLPAETDTPLVIDANAALTFPNTLKGFQPVPWRRPQFLQRLSSIDHQQLATSNSLNLRKAPGVSVAK